MKKQQQADMERSQSHGPESEIPDLYPNHSRSHSHDSEGDSYSNPVDLLPPNESQFINSQQRNHHEYYHQRDNSGNSQGSGGGYYRDSIHDENYSNPIDMLREEQAAGGPNIKVNINIKKQMGAVGGPSEYQGPARPNHLEIRGPLNRPAAPRAHLPEDNIAAMIDPTYTSSGSASTTPGGGLSPPGWFLLVLFLDFVY